MGRLSLAWVVALTSFGCSGSEQAATDAPADRDALLGADSAADASVDSAQATTQTMMIGTAGGSIDVVGATLVIPAGAVASDVSITVTQTTDLGPFGQSPSAIYLLLPEGQTFSLPVTFTLHLSAPPASGYTVVWSKLGVANPTTNTDYELRPTTVSGVDVSANNTHFSKVFGARFAVSFQ